LIGLRIRQRNIYVKSVRWEEIIKEYVKDVEMNFLVVAMQGIAKIAQERIKADDKG
jgi:hypothetical protein